MWGNMQATQKMFDDKLIAHHELSYEAIRTDEIIALKAEIMEYADETKCFKYWSLKDPSPKHIRLEEFVDGIHFYLSFSHQFYINPDELASAENTVPSLYGISGRSKKNPHTVKEVISYHLDQASYIRSNASKNDILLSFGHFMNAGRADGFTDDDIEKAYYMKNRVNHQRQSSGY